MRAHPFPKHYGNHFDTSPVADWLSDFSEWLTESAYCIPKHRGHLMIVRHVLEREPALPEDRRYGACGLDPMFRSRTRPRAFAHARWAFEQYLRERGRWITPPTQGPHQAILDCFRSYMSDLQGLAPATIEQKLRVTRAFLARTCAPPRTLADVVPRDVERFIAHRSRRIGRNALQSTVGYLRSFLRYGHEHGLCIAGLDEVDRPTRYRDEQPPRAIPWVLAQRLLASIDRSTPMGYRDHAALYLMTHYGLRTGEVGDLRLDDLDIRARVLCVRQSKVRSTLTLPLSLPACRVLARYLRLGRPRTARPELFLSVSAPLRSFTRGAIAEAFRRRVHRSGLPLTGHSPYGLRHGFALRLLERGVGITAIGELMGHHTLESTAVYLRLQTEALREVALPVPAIIKRRVS